MLRCFSGLKVWGSASVATFYTPGMRRSSCMVLLTNVCPLRPLLLRLDATLPGPLDCLASEHGQEHGRGSDAV